MNYKILITQISDKGNSIVVNHRSKDEIRIRAKDKNKESVLLIITSR